MRQRLAFALLCMLPLQMALGEAPAERFIGPDTIFAADADLTRIDAKALTMWGGDVFRACGVLGAAEPRAADQLQVLAKRAQRWLDDFRAAGGDRIIAVTQSEWILDGQAAV